MRGTPSGSPGEIDLAQGQDARGRVTQHRDVHLPAVDVLLDEAGLAELLDDGPDRPGELLRVVHDARVRDAGRPVLAHRLHDEREGQIARVGRSGQDPALGRGDAGCLEPLLHPVLAQREAQHLRRRAGERQPEQLEDEGYGALEAGVAHERLAQVEGAVGLELVELGAQRREVPVDADQVRLVAGAGECRGHARRHERHVRTRSPHRIALGARVLEVDVVEHRDALERPGAVSPGCRPLRRRLRRGRAWRCLDRHRSLAVLRPGGARRSRQRTLLHANLASSQSRSSTDR